MTQPCSLASLNVLFGSGALLLGRSAEMNALSSPYFLSVSLYSEGLSLRTPSPRLFSDVFVRL